MMRRRCSVGVLGGVKVPVTFSPCSWSLGYVMLRGKQDCVHVSEMATHRGLSRSVGWAPWDHVIR